MNWKSRTAYVFIKTTKGKAEQVWKQFQNWDNVIGSWIVTGNWDVIVWFDAQDWDTVHRCVSTIKNWNEVEQTSSHMVFSGHKTDTWWWEKPAGAWMLIRENKLDETPEKTKKWNWVTSGASIPGEWDYISWVQGENWDDLWSHILQVKNEDWETATYVPVKSWWNEKWKSQWW